MFWNQKKKEVPQDTAGKQTRTPEYGDMEQIVNNVCYRTERGTQWYPPLMVTAESLADRILDKRYVEEAVKLMEHLEPDDYTSYLTLYYKEGLKRYGGNWRYADIVTVLLGLSELLKPESYLEIGVRRGRSVCAVASKSPGCSIYMFDKWTPNYAGMENPGPSFIESELTKIGHNGLKVFHNGNSHQTLKAFFGMNPSIALDLVTVDGDHSFEGAVEDICDVLPHLKIGGAIVFDDICHPKHLYLSEVWHKLVENEQRFTTWTCADIGYGVGFALRRW